jgi:hypothetical protein
MKNILLAPVALLLCMVIKAQDLRIGIRAGLNLANEKIKNNTTARKGSSIARFHGGFVLDAPLSDRFYVQPQLLLTGKGSNDNNFIFSPWYVELPVTLVYKLPVSDLVKIYGGLGPGIGLGVFGKLRNDDFNFKRNLKFGETNDADYKTVDFTGGFELGAEIGSHVAAGVGYRWSFLDVTRGSNKVTHKVVNFSLVYFFGGDSGGTRKNSGSRSKSSRR